MHTETTVAPLQVKRTSIVEGITAALAKQRADRQRVEDLEAEGFDELIAVMDSTQKQRIVEFIRASYGADPEEISKENARQKELRDLAHKSAAERQDKPLLDLLALYTNVVNDVIEVAPNSAVLAYLTPQGGDEA